MLGDSSVPERDGTFSCWEGDKYCDASDVLPDTKLYKSELLSQEEVDSRGFVLHGNFSDLSSHDDLPENSEFYADFSLCNKEGVNYCSQSVNMHILLCGSCWILASMSALPG